MYDFFNLNVLILQNFLIPSNCKLTTHSSTKYFNILILYTSDTYFYNSSIKVGSIFPRPLTCTNPSIYWNTTPQVLILFKFFVFFKFNMPSQNSDKNNYIRFTFIKIIIKINIIKTYIKNTHSITIKYGIPDSSLK